MKHKVLLKWLAGFLSCMVLFTVLSRAAASAGMAKVQVRSPEKQIIDHSVTGSGKVRQTREEAVSTLPDQVVKTIYVSEGSQVEKGELLFEIDLPTLEEQIVRKKQELEKLKLQLEDTKSRSEAEETRKAMAENQAQEDLNLAAQRGSLTVNVAALELAEAQKALEDYRKSQGKDIEIIDDSVRDQLVKNCREKETAYKKAVNDLETLIRERDLKMTEAYLEEKKEENSPVADPVKQNPDDGTSVTDNNPPKDSGNEGTAPGGDGDVEAPGNTVVVPETDDSDQTPAPDTNPPASETPEPAPSTEAPQVETEPPTEAPQVETESPTEAPQVETESPTETPQVEAETSIEVLQMETELPTKAPRVEAESSIEALHMEAKSSTRASRMDELSIVALRMEADPSMEAPQVEVTPLTEAQRMKAALPLEASPAPLSLEAPSADTHPKSPSSTEGETAFNPKTPDTQARLISVHPVFTASENPIVTIDPDTSQGALTSLSASAELSIDTSKLTPAEKKVYDQYTPKINEAKKKAENAQTEKFQADEALSVYDQEKLASDSASSSQTEQQLIADLRSKQQAYDSALLSNAESVNAASHSLQNASAPEGSDSTARIHELEQEALELELDKLEALKKQKGQITSPVKGIVTSLSVTTGNKTGDGMAVLLADLSAGSKFVAEIPEDQEKYVSRNDSVILTPVNGKSLEGFTVDSLTDSSEDGMLTLTVLLPADTSLELGESADFKVEKKSGPYETCIPISALHEDNTEKFVFVVEDSESILGKETAARRITVTVQDKNSIYAALGDYELSGSQKVIIGSDKTINDGGSVRVEE